MYNNEWLERLNCGILVDCGDSSNDIICPQQNEGDIRYRCSPYIYFTALIGIYFNFEDLRVHYTPTVNLTPNGMGTAFPFKDIQIYVK